MVSADDKAIRCLQDFKNVYNSKSVGIAEIIFNPRHKYPLSPFSIHFKLISKILISALMILKRTVVVMKAILLKTFRRRSSSS